MVVCVRRRTDCSSQVLWEWVELSQLLAQEATSIASTAQADKGWFVGLRRNQEIQL